jgi:dUTP pyrophosphatase
MLIEIFIEKCREDAVIPEYAREDDAGMDISSAMDVIIKPGETTIIPTGLKIAVPEGYELQVRPRSGISMRSPLRISNSPGTIDSGYRDELGILVTNTSPICCEESDDNKPFTIDCRNNKIGTYLIRKGDRIAQIVLSVVPRMKILEVESIRGIGSDRGGGFGSTGMTWKSGKYE